MKHPALTRVMAVTLAVLCLVTLIAGGGALWKAHGDHQDDLRQRQLLRDRTDRAAELSSRLDGMQEQYELLSPTLEEEQKDHEAESSEYRVKLATYTATRAGVVMGRAMLEQSSNALWKAKRQLQDSVAQFEQIMAAFNDIYQIYLSSRGQIAQAHAVYQASEAYLASEEGQEAAEDLDMDQVLAAITATRRGIGILQDVARGAMDSQDGSSAAESMQRLRDYADQVSTQMGVEPQELATMAVRETVARADAAIEARIEAGASEAEAYAEADAICQATLGMSYSEAKSWLQDYGSAQSGGLGLSGSLDEIDVEQVAALLESIGGGDAMLEETLQVLEEEKQSLAAQEEAVLNDPEASSSSEAMLGLLKSELDSADRILAILSVFMDNARTQLDAISVQMDEAGKLIEEGITTVARQRLKMAETAKDLDTQRDELNREKLRLTSDGQKLDVKQELVDIYEETGKEFRSARAALMHYEGVSEAVNGGADLIESAEAELLRMTEEQEREFKWRIAIACVMIASCLPAVLCVSWAFEKAKLKRPWICAALCLIAAAAGEAASVRLGRGLWYSALFLGIAALAMLPLTAENTQKK